MFAADVAWSQTGNTQTTKPTTTKPTTTKPATTKPATTKPATSNSQPTGAKNTNQQGTQTNSGNKQLNEVQITGTKGKKPQGTEATGANNQGKTQTTKTQGSETQNVKTQTEEVKAAQPQSTDVPDTIVLVSGKKVMGRIQSVNSSKVSYYPQSKPKLEEMARKQVHKIFYNTGRVEFFNKPAFEMVSEGDFKTIVLTEKPEEVEGLFELGKVEAQSSKNSRNAKAAEHSADIRIQKKAANMGAIMVLITKRESKGGYGEVPTHFVEGIAYGFEAPKEQPKK